MQEKVAGEEGEWYTLGDLAKVKEKFKNYEPSIEKLLDLADPKDCYIWRLSELPPLKRWVSESGKLYLSVMLHTRCCPTVGW